MCRDDELANVFVLQGVDVDTTCEEFENGTALHIAAANLSLEAAKALLGFGADVQMTDELVRKVLHSLLLS